ncbi:MAG TPA: tetratricopeptide repeat protein [Candidatus Acidoferrales bacterium]|jgi:tetratricopeptide (TPR) repeat protein|nr:tetratricopeptide repeat protein [Candidatus Acidoferrales bacterium]
MKCLVLFAILLIFAVTPARAQEEPNPRSDAPIINPADDETPPPLTDLEKAEMRAEVLMARKDYVQAVQAYSELLKDHPKNAQMLNQLGIAYLELGDWGEAERSYKKAFRADKTFVSAINNLGALEYSKKRYRKAIKYYRKAIGMGGADRAVVYSNLGFAYYGNVEYVPAMAAFSKALILDPDVFARKSGVGAIIQQRSAPDPGMLYFLVAKSYAKAGDAEHAAHFLKVARDDGYRNFATAKTDPDFARVIKDRRVQEVFDIQPVFSSGEKKL